jgi:hypothetical protein
MQAAVAAIVRALLLGAAGNSCRPQAGGAAGGPRRGPHCPDNRLKSNNYFV